MRAHPNDLNHLQGLYFQVRSHLQELGVRIANIFGGHKTQPITHSKQFKEENKMASKRVKRCSVALVIEEMQIRTRRGDSHHENGRNPEAARTFQRTHLCGRRDAQRA